MSPLALVAVVLAAAYVYVYLKVVVHVRRKNGQKLYLPFESRTPAELPPAVWRKFAEMLPKLEALGFAVAGYVHHAGLPQDDIGRTDLYLALLRNDESGDLGTVTELFSQFKHVSSNVSFISFYTELEGGRSVATLNIPQVPVFKPDVRRPVFRFPDVGDPRFLYRVHRALLGRHAPGRRGVLPSAGMEVPFLCDSESRALRHQVECGYHYLDEAQGMCIPTWKGALLMTGRQMWGIRELLAARMRRQASSTLSSLGLSPN